MSPSHLETKYLCCKMVSGNILGHHIDTLSCWDYYYYYNHLSAQFEQFSSEQDPKCPIFTVYRRNHGTTCTPMVPLIHNPLASHHVLCTDSMRYIYIFNLCIDARVFWPFYLQKQWSQCAGSVFWEQRSSFPKASQRPTWYDVPAGRRGYRCTNAVRCQQGALRRSKERCVSVGRNCFIELLFLSWGIPFSWLLDMF